MYGYLVTRDGNRTEPEPNTPNSNPILRPFRIEPNEPIEFDNRTRTEPNDQVERTEPNSNSEILNCEQSYYLSLACGTVCVIGLVFFYYMCWISAVHQASCTYNCDRTKSEVENPSLAEPNPNHKAGRTEQNPNLHCWVRFPSLDCTSYSGNPTLINTRSPS